jgi:16S rRNA (guanine(966)-N(2))-methyltransferase RsmD
MLRIIGGEKRGRKLASFRDADFRPTADRVREALFDVLQDSVRGKWVLELFAGTGAVGLEALSRGARGATFVERDRRVCRLISKNVASLGYQDRAGVCHLDAFKFPGRAAPEDGRFDLVFIDPPYDFFRSREHQRRITALLEDLGEADCLEDQVVVILQHPREVAAVARSGNLCLVKQKRYGRTGLAFYQRRSREGAEIG